MRSCPCHGVHCARVSSSWKKVGGEVLELAWGCENAASTLSLPLSLIALSLTDPASTCLQAATLSHHRHQGGRVASTSSACAAERSVGRLRS